MKHVKECIFNLGQIDDPDNMSNKIDIMFDILVKDKQLSSLDLDVYEKLYVLLYLKSKIDDNDHTINYTCSSCGQITEGIVKLTDSMEFFNTDINIVIDDKLLTIKYANSIEESISVDILDELSIRDYKIVDNIFRCIGPKLTVTPECSCLICRKLTPINLDLKYLSDLVLPISFIDMYKFEVLMKLKGFSIAEVMNMYPYEMEIYSQSIDKLSNNS
jgi:hypothetical protein